LAAEIEQRFKVKVELIQSSGGVFKVRKDERLIFSKNATGRFPDVDEILKALE
jgi:predicted Rdx family selenoprotein